MVALQAADLQAGWARSVWESKLVGATPYWPWGSRDVDIQSLKTEWTEGMADALYEEMFGYPPLKYSFTWGYGLRRGA